MEISESVMLSVTDRTTPTLSAPDQVAVIPSNLAVQLDLKCLVWGAEIVAKQTQLPLFEE